jgi:ribonuclease R
VLEIDQEGNVIGRTFHPSLIKTKARMTYQSVYKIFEGDREERNRYEELLPDLLLMRELAGILNKKRNEKGSLYFDLTEPELVYVEGNLVSILPFEPNEAHQLIEEFMVVANEAVAYFLSERNIPLIFRVHPKPGEEDLRKLREMLDHFSIFLPQVKSIKSRDLQQALSQAKGRPWEKFVNLQVLKSLKLASYSPENRGHYGLAKRTYTHFTSPIRRYPDLVVHRILKSVIRGERPDPEQLDSLALLCSQQERRADQAERDLLEWKIYRHLQEKLGEEVDGIIVDISKAGLVVELDRYFVDGIIFFSDLGKDYYVRKTEKTLVGRSSGLRFELGDRLKGILASVDPLSRRISLTLSQERKKR